MEAQLFQAVLQRQYMGTALVGGAINLFYDTTEKQPVTTAKTPCLGLVSLKRFFTWKLYVLFPTKQNIREDIVSCALPKAQQGQNITKFSLVIQPKGSNHLQERASCAIQIENLYYLFRPVGPGRCEGF